jgi:nitrate reductase delta subunit
MHQSMKTYRALAALLGYPDEDLVCALPEIMTVIVAERLLSLRQERALDALAGHLRDSDLIEAQEHYVGLFDRVRSLSLHLFEHVHGESRDRGQAMVDLRSVYSRAGFELTPSELPDYLPAFLEFLSTQPLDEARRLLGDTVHLIDGMAARLEKRRSPYAAVLQALLALSGLREPATAVTDEDIRAEDDPALLDALWADQPAFGPDATGCGGATGAAQASSTRGGASVVHVHRRNAV